MKKKITAKQRLQKYAYGSDLSGLEGVGSQTGSMLQNSGGKGMGNMGMWGSLADGAIGIIDALSNPPQYQRQPTLNAMTMRNMVSPYNHFANGGEVDGDPNQPYHPLTNPDGYKPKLSKKTVGLLNGTIKPEPEPKYEPSDRVKKAKASLAVGSLIPYVGYFSQLAGVGGDLATSIKYGLDGQWSKAGEDLLQASAGLIPGSSYLRTGVKGEKIYKSIKGAKALKAMSDAKTVEESFAMGGSIDDLDEEQLAELQAQADEQGISIEDLFDSMNQNNPQEDNQDEEQDPNEQEDNQDEDDMFAYGGKIMSKRGLMKFAMGGTPIEVEDKEVVETPDGEVQQMQGATHEEGGIDINVPKGTKIFSDRLGVDGKSMQQRKLKRERAITRLEKLAKEAPQDKLLKNSYFRTLQNSQKEEQQDMMLQKVANKIYQQPQQSQEAPQGEQPKFAYGTPPDGYYDKTGWHFDMSSLLENQDNPNDNFIGPPNIKFGKNKMGQGFMSSVRVTPSTPTTDNSTIPAANTQPFSILGNTPQLQGVNQSNPYLWNNPTIDGSTPKIPVNPNAPKMYSVDNSGDPVNNNTPIIPLGKDAQGNVVANNPNQVVANNALGKSKFTMGDYLGMAGNAFNAVAPILNTLKNAKGNKPNINRFRGFGKDALDTNQFTQDYVDRIRANQLTDVDTSANSQALRNRNSASSVNTIRALDATTDMAKQKAKTGVNDAFSKQMMAILGQRGQLQNMRDKVVMTGEQQRDMEDKGDRDNFYSNMAQNLVNFGTNVQGMGKNLNDSNYDRNSLKIMAGMTKNGVGIEEQGKLINNNLSPKEIETGLKNGSLVKNKNGDIVNVDEFTQLIKSIRRKKKS